MTLIGDRSARAVSASSRCLELAVFWEPSGLSLAGRTLYVADTNNHAIRAVDLDTDRVRTLDVRA